MSPDIPSTPPEAEVIRLARMATGMTAQAAAEATRSHDGRGVSAAYWRDVERGYGGRRGLRVPTRASARVLAAMARAVGVAPAQLAGTGREDAARVLEEILRREGVSVSLPTAATQPLERDGALFPQMNAQMTAVTEPYSNEIAGRVHVAARAEARRRGVSPDVIIGEVPDGADIFPDSPADAARWDGLKARGFAGEQFTTWQLVQAMSVLWALAPDRQARSGQAASG